MKTKLYQMMNRLAVRQSELARRSRIDSSRINRYASGCCFPNPHTLARLAKALGCKPNDIRESPRKGVNP